MARGGASVKGAMREAAAQIQAGRVAEAMALLDGAVASDPSHAPAQFMLGSLALQHGQFERALPHLRKAAERNRNVPEYHLYLAAALHTLGHLDEAAAANRQVLKLAPRHAAALRNLGDILAEQGRREEALPYIQRAIDIDPKFAAAHHRMGGILLEQGQINDALASFGKALAADPDFAPAYLDLAKCLNFLPGANPALIADATMRWARLQPPPGRLAWRNDAAPERRLRIGYVSADFRRHPVAWFTESLLRAHDRSAVEITCYSNNRVDDEATERLKSLADRWRPIRGLDDAAGAALIRDDAIDILVDLSGHTTGNRLGIFLAKPAPVQCTWLGYYATTGLATIDYIIADRFVLPEGEEGLYVEKPWRLPDSYLCFTPPDPAVAIGELPASRNGRVTFGSCNNVFKVNLAVVGLWSRLLHEVPDSALLLRSHVLTDARVRSRLAEQFAANGVSGERLTLLPVAPREELLATYNAIDIALDPFPYGGGTTTAEALWMGVPVVSLRGDRFTGRVSESILAAIGLPDLVVADADAYLARAAALAADLPRLAALRADLRRRVERSPICEALRFARNLEAAYRAMWREWCAGRKA
jgi:protein O-GlcNAc transferase